MGFMRQTEGFLVRNGRRTWYRVVGEPGGGPPPLVICHGGPGITSDYLASVAELVRALPAETRAAIERHEAAGTTDSAEYQQALHVFYGRHVCRRPVPDELLRTLAALDEDSTVYRAMAGPSEFTMSGTLKDWDITDRLGLIEVPVLLISGQYDEVAPAAVEQLHRGLRDASWLLFEE